MVFCFGLFDFHDISETPQISHTQIQQLLHQENSDHMKMEKTEQLKIANPLSDARIHGTKICT